MDAFREFIHMLISLDLIALVVAFGAGVVIAPVVILIRGACWWKRRLKWAAVALVTSWFGLWLFWRDQLRAQQDAPQDASADPNAAVR